MKKFISFLLTINMLFFVLNTDLRFNNCNNKCNEACAFTSEEYKMYKEWFLEGLIIGLYLGANFVLPIEVPTFVLLGEKYKKQRNFEKTNSPSIDNSHQDEILDSTSEGESNLYPIINNIEMLNTSNNTNDTKTEKEHYQEPRFSDRVDNSIIMKIPEAHSSQDKILSDSDSVNFNVGSEISINYFLKILKRHKVAFAAIFSITTFIFRNKIKNLLTTSAKKEKRKFIKTKNEKTLGDFTNSNVKSRKNNRIANSIV